LVRLVDELHAAMKNRPGRIASGRISQLLAEYMVYHFGFEEKLVADYGYPETAGKNRMLSGKIDMMYNRRDRQPEVDLFSSILPHTFW